MTVKLWKNRRNGFPVHELVIARLGLRTPFYFTYEIFIFVIVGREREVVTPSKLLSRLEETL